MPLLYDTLDKIVPEALDVVRKVGKPVVELTAINNQLIYEPADIRALCPFRVCYPLE